MTSTNLTPASLAGEINAELRAMQEAGQTALEHAIHVGEMLIQVKEQLRHGEFGPWIEANIDCTWDDASAAHVLRTYGIDNEITLVATAPLGDLVHSLRVVLRRYGISRRGRVMTNGASANGTAATEGGSPEPITTPTNEA